MTGAGPAGEFARIVKLDRLPERLTIEANAAELAALAERFDLPAIGALRAETSLARIGDAIEVRGRLMAAFTQHCAVTDQPFASTLEEPLSIRFVPALAALAEDEEHEFHPDEPDEIEYAGAAFDLGEAVAQSFGLAIDPYATGPAAEAEAARRDAGLGGEAAPSGPFAALAALKPGGNA